MCFDLSLVPSLALSVLGTQECEQFEGRVVFYTHLFFPGFLVIWPLLNKGFVCLFVCLAGWLVGWFEPYA